MYTLLTMHLIGFGLMVFFTVKDAIAKKYNWLSGYNKKASNSFNIVNDLAVIGTGVHILSITICLIVKYWSYIP